MQNIDLITYHIPPQHHHPQQPSLKSKSMTRKFCKFSPRANNRNSHLNKLNSLIAPRQWNIITVSSLHFQTLSSKNEAVTDRYKLLSY